MSKYLLFLCCAVAFAGQSIQLSTQTASAAVPRVNGGVSYRVQVSLHDWPVTAEARTIVRWSSDNLFALVPYATGPNSISFQAYDSRDNAAVCNASLTGLPSSFITIRFQHQITSGTSGVDFCQAWDSAGNMVWSTAALFTTDVTSSFNDGVFLTGFGSGLSVNYAYFQIYNDIVATNARPPVTADTTANCRVYLKFDLGNDTGSLTDTCSAGPYPASLNFGSPVYGSTPAQDLVVPIIQTMNAPAWGNTASLSAGTAAQLDGTASYSQADASAAVTFFWQALSGPAPLAWGTHNSATPTILGAIFGSYDFQLVVTDINGVQATARQQIGAVAMDPNGVIVTGNPDVDFLLGPMIAFGKNPWGYQDYWSARASSLRAADYATPVVSQGQSYPGWSTLGKPQWEFPGQGTVSYNWNCKGAVYFCDGVGTTLSGSITSTATTITVNDATKLDLTSFPTRVIVYDGTNMDELRVVSAASNTLTLAYDPSALPRHSFASGVIVIQSKVTGSGTLFLTDATAPVCPVGIGPPGVSVYSTGTIALTANSTSVVGSGTTFTSSMVGGFVRVLATHSGTAFTFVAKISAFVDSTHLTLARVFPSDADTAGGLAYSILPATRTVVLEYDSLLSDPIHAPNDKARHMFGTSWCESETALYLNPIFPGGLGNSFASQHDIPVLNGTHQTGQKYSVTDTTGWVSQAATGGISFYGEGMAHRSLYLRSGLASAYDAAAVIDNYWIRSPWGNADGNGTPRLYLGGGGIGAFVSKITDPNSLVSWAHLRGYANMGKQMVDGIAANGCDAWADSRDSGYAYAWLVLAAIYDPDITSAAAPGGIPWRTHWQNQIGQMQANDAACQRADHSFANGFYFNVNAPPVTVTNGSTAVTGSGIPASVCNGVGSGTATVTNGSNALTVVTGSIPLGLTIYLTGTSGGNPFFQALSYSGTGAAATLGGNWLGDSGTISWTAATQDGSPFVAAGGTPGPMLTIATDNNDLVNLKKNWSCTWNDSTSLTLNRPWDGASGTYRAYATNLAGYGQQPFMLGIKSYAANLLATQSVPELSSFVGPYQTFTANSTSWIWNTGMDQQLLGTNYARVFQQCEPGNTVPAGINLGFRSAGCTFGTEFNSVVLSREQNAETSAAHSIFYQNDPTLDNRTLGDKYYGALWCATPYTTGGVYCDANSTANNFGASNFPDIYIHAGKWFGFFTGMGMSHRWPAVRLGGVLPASNRTVYISLRLADVPNATSVKVLVTAPSGAKTSFACSSQPCAITVDDRQGAHWYRIQYLSIAGMVLSESEPDLLPGQ